MSMPDPHPPSTLKTELVWEGKYDPQGRRRDVNPAALAVPLRCVETIDVPSPLDDHRNMLIWGDNRGALASLVERLRGQVDLVYIDPPFAVGTDFTVDVPVGSDPQAAHQHATELVAYRDTWGRGIGEYLAMMYDRLVLLRHLLSDRGTIYVHCDSRANFLLRAMMDEIYGAENFRNEIIWCYRGGGVPRNDFAPKHDTILRYTKTDDYLFCVDRVRVPYSDDVRNSGASRYDKSYRDNKVYEGYRPHASGKHPDDWWPIQPLMPSDKTERLDYPTQKPIELLQRIVDASSEPESIVLDAFAGSGTTLAAAAGCRVRRRPDTKGKLEYYFVAPRRWIGIDEGRLAIHTIRKRMIELERARREAGQPGRSLDVFTTVGAMPHACVSMLTPRCDPAEQGTQPEAATLEAEAIYRPDGGGTVVDIRLVRFEPVLANIPTRRRRARPGRTVADGFDYIDFWAVDFDHCPGRPFRHHWQDYRTRKNHTLQTVSDLAYRYAVSGRYHAAVKVVDIFGQETSVIVVVNV
jgi:DNA modification methylase